MSNSLKKRAESIRAFLLKEIPSHPSDIVAVAEKHFKVTRTSIHRHLNMLLSAGEIVKSGSTRATQYYLASELEKTVTFKITTQLSEFDVWNAHFEKALSHFSDNVRDILYYCFTEMFNNAIEHSKGKKITISSYLRKGNIHIQVQDDGIGVFYNIATGFAFSDFRESVLQLSIGKTTTDPKNHTGEGIFFTSRAVDQFEIRANGLQYFRDNKENDWGLEAIDEKLGTMVAMTISSQSTRNLETLFKAFQHPESLAFDRTSITVELSRYGEERFVSRSQAKRILRNLDKFRQVTFDFKKVRMVGQGFVDQVFRVYQSEHPEIVMDYINASEDVEFMIKRGIATAQHMKNTKGSH